MSATAAAPAAFTAEDEQEAHAYGRPEPMPSTDPLSFEALFSDAARLIGGPLAAPAPRPAAAKAVLASPAVAPAAPARTAPPPAVPAAPVRAAPPPAPVLQRVIVPRPVAVSTPTDIIRSAEPAPPSPGKPAPRRRFAFADGTSVTLPG